MPSNARILSCLYGSEEELLFANYLFIKHIYCLSMANPFPGAACKPLILQGLRLYAEKRVRTRGC
ncbi:hypothetical protein DNK10_23885 [Pseudomonas daroniae]|nr:hypothetical protein DNK10_23885 [Pseudomonas daroniae]